MSTQQGKGETGAVLIIAAVVYFTFLSQFALALGYEPSSVAAFTQRLSELNVGVFSFLFDIAAWIVSSIAVYWCMIGFSVTGSIPLWVGAFFFVPVGLGVGWLVFELIRG